ncbi:hypothetical protein AD935_00125, partial [Gluconobacter japonicus]
MPPINSGEMESQSRPQNQRVFRTLHVFIERLWRSLKYECVYLHAFETGSELRVGLTKWITHYNGQR